MRIRPAHRGDIPTLLRLVQGLADGAQHLNTWILTEALRGAGWTDHETVLVDEDYRPLLRITQQMLERGGYRVLSASGERGAIQLLDGHCGRVAQSICS